MLESFLEAALEAELESHFDETERQSGNRRNGKESKQIKTQSCTLTIDTARDRTSSFEPEFIKKLIPMLYMPKIFLLQAFGQNRFQLP